MKTKLAPFAVIVFLCVPLYAAEWSQFRGSNNQSVAYGAADTLPTDWKKNVAWQMKLPGRGPSSPIVIGNRVVVTCSSGAKQDRLHVLCFDTDKGDQLWHRQFWATGRTMCHPESAIAAPTPASDGERIFAFYSSNDLICLDLDGNLQWYRGLAHDFPKAGNDVGMSSSPLVIDDTVIVQVEAQGDSFATGIDTAGGVDRWHIKRKQASNWSSPTRFDAANGEKLVLLQSRDGLTAHDPRSGSQLWKYEAECSGIPSPAVKQKDSTVYVAAEGLTALKAPASAGKVEVLWKDNRLAPGSSSPVVHDGRIYTLRSGVLTCSNAETGKAFWKLRVKGGKHYATPVLAGDLLFVVNFDGVAQAIKLGEKSGEIVATTELGEAIQSSPAVAAGAIYLRSDGHLWKFARK